MYERNMVNGIIPFLESLQWGKYHSATREFELYDGNSSIWFLSGENPKAAEGIHACFCWMDEPGQSDPLLWQIIKRRVARAGNIKALAKDEAAIANGHPEGEYIRAGGIVLSGYPLSSEGWFRDEVHEPATSEDPEVRDPNVIELAWKSEDAPGYDLEFLAKERKVMPKYQYEQLYEGKFTRATDAIYPPIFVPSREDCLPLEEMFATCSVYGGADYGRYTAGVVFGFDAEDVCWLLGCYQSDPNSDAKVHDNAEEFRKIGMMKAAKVFGDPSAIVAWREYKEEGMAITECPVHGEGSVSAGIDRLYAMINTRKFVIHPDAPNAQLFINYMSNYRWDPKNPSKPIKKDDHLPDAQRYGIMGARPAGVLQVVVMRRRRNPFYA